MNKTYMQKPADVKHEWHVIDAKDRILGQVATEAAYKLMGKQKTTYTPHVDNGDFVVIVNAGQIRVTGNKGMTKKYYKHSLFPGGIREASFAKMQEVAPAKIIERAVFNMIPGNRLRSERMTRLKIFIEADHTYQDKFAEKK